MTQDKNTYQIQTQPPREEIREYADRLVAMLPSVKEVGKAGALALAHVALSLGLNPFTGEVWAWKNRDGTTTLMAGIKGIRRAARRQAKELGGYYTPQLRSPTDLELEGVTLQDGDIVRACDIYIWTDETRKTYALTSNATTVSGLGIYRRGEKTRMEPVMVARKRAEADALKQAFDLPMALGIEQGREIMNHQLTTTIKEPRGSPGPDHAPWSTPLPSQTSLPGIEPLTNSVKKDMADLGFGGE